MRLDPEGSAGWFLAEERPGWGRLGSRFSGKTAEIQKGRKSEKLTTPPDGGTARQRSVAECDSVGALIQRESVGGEDSLVFTILLSQRG